MKDRQSPMSEIDFRMPRLRKLEKGQIIPGTVVAISKSHVFIDVGAKSEASMEITEVLNDEGQAQVKIGDQIEAYIVEVEPEVVLSHRMARGRLSAEALQDAHDLGIPVEGKVASVNKGGVEVDFNGTRAFCPISQIELGYCADANVYVGQTLPFRVIEFAEDGRKIVVSRRALLEEERAEAAAALQDQIIEGAELDGVVATLQPYGAFVDLGGIQGMVHISQIAHGHIEHPEEALRVGQKVRVRVMKVERDPKHPDKMRVGLSMRALLDDPWLAQAAQLTEGTVVSGKVVRIQPFGAFVEIAPGVDGLVHVSELSDRRVKSPAEVVTVGQTVQATIIKVDAAAKRVSLSLRGQESASGDELTIGAAVETIVDGIKPFGLLVRIKGAARNMRGLIPTEELGLGGQNANLRKSYAEGAEVKAMITAIEPDTGKVRLSVKAFKEQQEQDAFSEFAGAPAGKSAAANASQNAPTKQTFGTFGDLLSAKLKK